MMAAAAEVAAATDEDDRLLAIDPALAALNERAGGALGERLAVPQLASAVRLARRLGVIVSRGATIADGEVDWDVWVRASPDESGVRLTVSDWRERRVPSPLAEPIDPEAWRWRSDSALRITHASPGLADQVGKVLEGRPAAAAFRVPADPLASAEAFVARSERSSGMIVRGAPLHDPSGAFAGYAGSAHVHEEADPLAEGAGLAGSFTLGLDRALRRPLARIVANADSIAAQTEGPILRDYADYAADIAGAGRHLLALVDDLVDLQAVERSDFALAPEAIDLADLTRRAAGLLTVRAEEAGVTIERPRGDAAAPALGDFRRVLQILVNLIGNAVRYAPRGSRIILAVGPGSVSVADEGRGIAAADQERVFEKFARLDPGEAGGSGLGLYIARRLARAMGGDLSVESAPGIGARFTLQLAVGEVSPVDPSNV